MAARRGNGEARIIKRGDSYWTQVMIAGRRHSVTGRTVKEVQQKRRAMLSGADKGIVIPSNNHSLAQYAERWLENVAVHNPRHNTYQSYSDHMRLYILPYIGNIRLHKLQPMHLSELYATLLTQGRLIDGLPSGRKLAPKTVRNTHLTIHVALEQAMRWGLVTRNAASLVAPPRLVRKEIAVLSKDEVRRLLAGTSGTRLGTLLSVAINTGMRQSEILGLRWQDVDLDQGLLRIRQQYNRNGTFVEPKSAKGIRNIDIPPSTLADLRDHKVRQLEERLVAGDAWRENGLVFTSYHGKPLNHRNLVRDYWNALRRCGIDRLDFHALRHTHATHLLADGVPVLDVSERLGHSSATITMEVYGHVLPDAGRGITARLELLFG